MQQFPFPQGDGFGGIASHEVSCRRFVFVLGHDGDRYAEYGRLVGGGSLFEDGPRVTSASTRSTASPSSCLVPSLSPSSGGRLRLQRIPFSTICSACRFHAFRLAERWLAQPFMQFPRPSFPVDGRQRLSARSFCLRAESSEATRALLAQQPEARRRCSYTALPGGSGGPSDQAGTQDSRAGRH